MIGWLYGFMDYLTAMLSYDAQLGGTTPGADFFALAGGPSPPIPFAESPLALGSLGLAGADPRRLVSG